MLLKEFDDFEQLVEEFHWLVSLFKSRNARQLGKIEISAAKAAMSRSKNADRLFANAQKLVSKVIDRVYFATGEYEAVTKLTSVANEKTWFLSAVQLAADKDEAWGHFDRAAEVAQTAAMAGTRFFQAAHLPFDKKLILLDRNWRVRRELEVLLGHADEDRMQAMAVLGIDHLSSMARLMDKEHLGRSVPFIDHPTLTNRMNRAVVIAGETKELSALENLEKIRAAGGLPVTPDTSLREVLEASMKVLQDSQFAPIYQKLLPLVELYRRAIP